MKNIYKKLHYIIIVFSALYFYGCSSDKTKNTDEKKDVASNTQENSIDTSFTHKELLTVKDTIEARLADAMERYRYFDNSGLYENEFAYFTDETSFDEYLKLGQLAYHPPGDVIALAVDSLQMYGHDSASVWLAVTLEFQNGSIEKKNDQQLRVFYHNDKWIKPTVSVIKNQIEYDDLIRQAEEASNWGNE